tara:strand:+ start:510 stop:629 length:120 start_codon:yes stop_codon:yes gene_type:complete
MLKNGRDSRSQNATSTDTLEQLDANSTFQFGKSLRKRGG